MLHLDPSPARRRAVALGWGLATHGAFALAVATMAWSLHEGLHPWGASSSRSLPDFARAVLVDLVLLLQFPVVHSWLLTRGARPSGLQRLVLGPPGGTLATTRFVLASSLQLVLVFAAWQPLGGGSWRPHGPALAVHEAAFAVSWVLLVWAMHDAGLSVQTGSLGWTSAWRGTAPRFPAFRPRGLYRVTRHPIYLSFALVLWTAPAWTVDRVVLAAAWTVYGVVGARRKERRLAERHGEAWQAYAARTPFFWPGRPRRAELALESPAPPRMLSGPAADTPAPGGTADARGACASSS